MEIKKVLIAGSRGFTDYEQAKKYIDLCISNIRGENEIVIVSGGAKGTDLLGEQYAKENGFKIEKYLPDWRVYSKGAGIVRNKKMVEISDYIICFWNGITKGTESAIKFAQEANKKLMIKIIE